MAVTKTLTPTVMVLIKVLINGYNIQLRFTYMSTNFVDLALYRYTCEIICETLDFSYFF